MGCSYYARVVFGVRLTREALTPMAKVPGCQHEKPSDAKFCPECGKPAFEELRRPIEGYEQSTERYKGWYVYSFGGDYEWVVIGKLVSELRLCGYKDQLQHPLPDVGHLERIADEVTKSLQCDPLVKHPSDLAFWHVMDVS